MELIRTWFGLSKPVTPKNYWRSGLFLFALKYLLDAGVVWCASQTFLDPLRFLSPLASSRLELVHDAWLWAMVLLSLPFLWVGLSMSVRRAADARIPPAYALFFVVPGLNFLLMIFLSFARTKTKDWGFEKVDPIESTKAKDGLVALLVGASTGFVMILFSVYVLRDYGSVLFAATPLFASAAIGYVHNRKVIRTTKSTHAVMSLAIALLGGCVLLFAIEGAICLAMAFPIAWVVGIFGATIGRALAVYRLSKISHIVTMLCLLPFLGAAEPLTRRTQVFEVQTSIEIDAPREMVWPNILSFSELDQPHEWFFKMGIAHPVRARIEGEGVGAVRYCEFSTGPFVEPITVWDEPNRLAFDVLSQPLPMKEFSPHGDIHPPHLDGYFQSKRGEFRLTELPGGRTRLEGSTWYEMKIFPRMYWSLISDALLHSIHSQVLEHIKRSVEETSE